MYHCLTALIQATSAVHFSFPWRAQYMTMTRYSLFKSNRRGLFLLVILIGIGLGVSLVAYNNFRRYETSLIEQKVEADSRVLRREIEMLRNVAELLAKNPLFIGLDDQAISRQKMAALVYLKQIQRVESIVDAFVLDSTGTCILSSNRRFEGKNYSFRPYFTEAVASGQGSYLAYGVTSKRLGLYLSRRVNEGAGKGGVVVIKVDPLALLAKVGLSAGNRGEHVRTLPPVDGIVSRSGVLVSHDESGLWVLDKSVLGKSVLQGSRQFDLSLLQDMGCSPGTWEKLYRNGFLSVSVHGISYNFYLQPIIPDRVYYFRSFREAHTASGLPLLSRTMALLVISFFLALIPLTILSLSVERQRQRLSEMEQELVLEKRLKNEHLERFKSVIEQNQNGFWIVQPDSCVLETVNEALCTMLGYSADELVGKPAAELFTDEDVVGIFSNKGFCHADRGRIRVNLRGAEGNLVPVHIDANLMRDSDGNPLFRYAFITDLRQKIKDLEKIRLLEAAVDQSASSIVITDIDGQIRYVNPAFTKITGYSREEVLGQNPRILKSGRQEAAFYRQMWEEIIGGKVWNGRFCNRKKDGTLYWEDAVIAPVRDEDYRISHFVAIKNDVTEKVRIEEQLEDKLAELELIVKHAGVGIVYVKGREILGVNEAAANILGLAIEEILHRDIFTLFPGNGNYKRFDLDYYPELRRGNIVDVEFQTRNGKGQEIRVRLTGQAVDRTALDEKGAVWIIQDMTAVHAYQKQLEEARKQAEEASRSKSNFLANMSHEIRTPMNSIIGMTRMVQETDLDPLQKKYIGRIEASSTMLLGLLNDILDFSKIEAGQLLLEEQPFLLETLLDNVYSTMIGLARDKNLVLRIDRDENIPAAFIGDAVRLGQILVNLVGNGIKFTDRGEVCIHVSMDKDASTEDRVALHFAVSDTGIGIPVDKQRHLFQSFQQADSSISRRYGGTGLGLAISRQLVQLMGGEISLTSAEGMGTTFSFTIALPPCPGDQVQRAADHEQKRESGITGLKILLVEDNEANRELGTIILESSGQRVQVAEHGSQALELLADIDFDVVLMDVQMPEMDGVTATRVIRAVEEGREPATRLTGSLLMKLQQRLAGGHVPIIALTAHAMDSDRARCLDAGMDEYLTKPFQPEQVLEVLQRFSGKEGAADSLSTTDEPAAAPTDDSEREDDLGNRVRNHLSATYKLQPEQVEQVMVTSARSLSKHLDKAMAALAAEDGERLRNAVHGLKGNLLHLGLSEHGQTAAMIEQHAAAGRIRSCRQPLEYLRAVLAELTGQGR